ncbi:hypothetical protein GGER_41360 [Serratia rubidaea]
MAGIVISMGVIAITILIAMARRRKFVVASAALPPAAFRVIKSRAGTHADKHSLMNNRQTNK